MRAWPPSGGALVLGLVLAVAAGCGDREAAPGPTVPGATSEQTPAPTATAVVAAPTPTATAALEPQEPLGRLSAGCSLAVGPPSDVALGQAATRGIESGGRERAYRIYVPASLSESVAAPLVLNWHGRGSTAIAQEIYSGLTPLAEREQFILVSPEGVNRQFLTVAGVDDVQFARDLVAALGEEFCLDLERVFSTGMSNGGFMSTQLACQAPDLVAAVAPVTGQTPASNCTGGGVPTLGFFGTEDQVVPFGPGLILGAVPYQGTEAAMAGWALANGCEGDYIETQVSEHVVLREWERCRAYTAYYAVTGGGHTWPGAAIPVPGLGVTTQEISATELIWEFFAGIE